MATTIDPVSLQPSSLVCPQVRLAMEVLAEFTSATVMVFDAQERLIAGPVTASAFTRRLLSTTAGRAAVISAHHRSIGDGHRVPAAATGTATQILDIGRDGGPGGSNDAAGPPSHPAASASLTAPVADALTVLLDDGGFERFAHPLVVAGRRAGTLTVGDRPRQPLTDAALAQIASAAGIELEILRIAARDLMPWDEAAAVAARRLAAVLADLLAELADRQDQLNDRLEELSVVYSITRLLADTQDLQQILNKTTRMVCDVMKAKACSIRLLDEISGALIIKAVHNLSEAYLNKGPVTVEDNPIDGQALRGAIVRIADAPSDPRTRYPEEARQEGIVSGLVCGLIFRGRAVGVVRVYTGEPHEFSPFEESLLRAVAAQAAAAIVNARLLAETIEAERFSRQLAYAGQVQRRMIPTKPPACATADIGAIYRPTYNVGGDFYDFIQLPKCNLGIGIADVSGKGVPASLLMASLRSALRVYAYFMYDIDRIMSEINRHVCRETTIGEFVTAFYGVLSPDGRRLTYAVAGHDPPLLLRRGRIQQLETGGMVLGVDPEARFERDVLELQPGDVLLLYTDGAVEALNFHDEAFGRDRLAQSLIRHADQAAQPIAQNILWDLRRFRGLADRTDDVTMVVLKIRHSAVAQMTNAE